MAKKNPWLITYGPSKPSAAGAVGQVKGASGSKPYVPGVGFINKDFGRPRHQAGYNYGKGLINFISPIKGMSLGDYSSSYGPRVHPITGRSSFHTGVDLPTGMGTPVIAPSGGIVLKTVSGDSIYGNQIVLDHGRHYESMYGHLSGYVVKPGQRIHRGQVIGYVGSTGLSTGPHLHFETWKNYQPVNPEGLFKVLG